MIIAKAHIIILYGFSGTGKTEILNKLQDKGEQMLDLENLTNHNGSAFGGLGRNAQPEQEDFDQLVQKKLATYSEDKPVWVEYESNYLGKLQIPDELYQSMLNSDMLILQLEREKRIDRIVKSYAEFETDELLTATHKLKKKLSSKKYRLARKSIQEKDFKTAVSIFLTYYDKVYENQLKTSKNHILGELNLEGNNAEEFVSQVLKFYQSYLHKSRNPE